MAKAGLEDVVATTSSICDVNGKEGRLIYQGYDIHELAQYSTFEEVVYLLWFGRMPIKSEYDSFTRQLKLNRQLPEGMIKIMSSFPKTTSPMAVLRTSVSLLSMYDPDVDNNSQEANIRKAIRLTARIPTIVAYWDNIRNQKELISPREDLNLAANFLYLLTGKAPDELSTKSLDVALILHADHELNASTFSARVTAATLSDIYSAITAAIGTLAGPLHGGANQEVIKMLLEIGELSKVEPYIKKILDEHQKIMGFGHRVYKTEDPRAWHLRKMSEELGKKANDMKWYQMSRKIEELVLQNKGLHANVDFYSASVYYLLGIPIDLFTPVFAISRISGWAAHVLEQYAHNRLIRPRADYTGPSNLTYEPLSQR